MAAIFKNGCRFRALRHVLRSLAIKLNQLLTYFTLNEIPKMLILLCNFIVILSSKTYVFMPLLTMFFTRFLVLTVSPFLLRLVCFQSTSKYCTLEVLHIMCYINDKSMLYLLWGKKNICCCVAMQQQQPEDKEDINSKLDEWAKYVGCRCCLSHFILLLRIFIQ